MTLIKRSTFSKQEYVVAAPGMWFIHMMKTVRKPFRYEGIAVLRRKRLDERGYVQDQEVIAILNRP
ncbi:MAG: hypothetical protein JO108_06975 [Acidobacteriaceae bacterium]|nr:hypothetical protein [Acidobacteriaceae bacterium]